MVGHLRAVGRLAVPYRPGGVAFFGRGLVALEQALGTFDIETTQAERDEILSVYDELDPFDDVRSGLAAVAEEYDVYILSMGTPEMLDSMIEYADLGDIIEDAISVHEIRTLRARSWYREFRELALMCAVYNIRKAAEQQIPLPSGD